VAQALHSPNFVGRSGAQTMAILGSSLPRRSVRASLASMVFASVVAVVCARFAVVAWAVFPATLSGSSAQSPLLRGSILSLGAFPVPRSERQSGRMPSAAQTPPPAAPGFFPGRPEAAPEGSVQVDVADFRPLREQAALLTEEMRLLREALRSPGVVDRLRAAVQAQPGGSLVDENNGKAATQYSPIGSTFNDVMFEKQNGRDGVRFEATSDYLRQVSQRVVARRAGGELPLGQVAQPGA